MIFTSDIKVQRVSQKETVWLFIILIVSKVFFADIQKYINTSGTAAYMQTAWCAALALVLFAVSACLSRNRDIFTAAELALGNSGAKIIGVLLALLMLADSGVMLRVYADIISSIALPEASDFLILLALGAAAAFAAFAGLGTLTSYSLGAGIVIIVFLAAILILNIPNYDITNIYPLLGNGTKSIFSGFDGLTPYADIFLIFLLITHFRENVSVKKSGITAIIISGVIITATTLLYVLTVPYPASADFALPVLEIAFDVNLDVVFQRAEGLFLFLWIFSGFIVIGAYVCFGILSFEKSFRLSDRRGVIGVFIFLAVGIALLADTAALQEKVYSLFYYVFTVTAFALPLAVYGIGALRRRI